MSTTITKTKKRMGTMEDIKTVDDGNNPVQYVLHLSKTLTEADTEIKQLRRELKANKHKSQVIVQGLLNRIRELEEIKSHNEKLLKELGAKDDYIEKMNREMRDTCKEAIKGLKTFKSNDDDVNDEFTTEELEELNQQAIRELQELLNNN